MNDSLNSPFPVDAGIIERFRTSGYVRLKDVLPGPTIRRYGEEITRLTVELDGGLTALDQRSTYERAFRQVMNLWRHSEVVARFVMGKRLARIAAALLEIGGVRLYHDQSLYKEPSGGFTPAHADQYYWPLSSDRAVTAWIPLQPVSLEMGPLAFFAGSHRESFGRDLPISDESEAAITRAMEARGFQLDEEPYELGDVSFHAGWTFHRAGPNRTDAPRSVMTMIYIDRDMVVAPPINEQQEKDLARWLPELNPGDRAASSLNPVLY